MIFYSNKHKKNYFNTWLKYIIVFIVLFFLIFLNFYFKVGNISVEFYDEERENVEIQNSLKKIISNNIESYIGYWLFSNKKIEKFIKDEFKIISKIDVYKNYNGDVRIIVEKNTEFFVACTEDDDFLIKCMKGNTQGDLFGSEVIDSGDLLKITVSSEALFDPYTYKKLDSPDSLYGARILNKDDFKVLRELINYFNNYNKVEKVYIGNLKIVKIYFENFYIIASLDKGFLNTIKDFELIKEKGVLKEYLIKDGLGLEYLDLSYKDKVFYRFIKDKEKDKDKDKEITEFKNSTSTSGTTSEIINTSTNTLIN